MYLSDSVGGTIISWTSPFAMTCIAPCLTLNSVLLVLNIPLPETMYVIFCGRADRILGFGTLKVFCNSIECSPELGKVLVRKNVRLFRSHIFWIQFLLIRLKRPDYLIRQFRTRRSWSAVMRSS